jgi:bifunctional UDP-N-acetylglucosamine pyrophosphorylase/glucosamine-1-phosphate N-acetyltransferase
VVFTGPAFPIALIINSAALSSLVNSDTSLIASTPDINAEMLRLLTEIGVFAADAVNENGVLKSGAKIGNFVETKKSIIGKNSKVNHLSYIGNTTIGQSSNIGAGTITCNYDGVNKNKTNISDNVFIGSNTSLVAPLKIGKNSIVGAGSVITRNVKKNSLALTRPKQQEIKNYKKKK